MNWNGHRPGRRTSTADRKLVASTYGRSGQLRRINERQDKIERNEPCVTTKSTPSKK